MFVKLFELLRRINGTREMQNIIIIVITEAFTLVTGGGETLIPL